jgi:hypothetical protein
VEASRNERDDVIDENQDRIEKEGSPPQPSDRMSAELHIAELVLHGFAPQDRLAIADSLELEFGRLIGERGAPRLFKRPARLERLEPAMFKVAPGAGPLAVGAQIAQTLYQLFSPEKKEAAPRFSLRRTQNRK